MNTKNFKNVLSVVLIAILSSLITIFGYNYYSGNKSVSPKKYSAKISDAISGDEYGETFKQDDNVRLTNLTTAQGYPDFTEAAEKSIHAVVHVITKSVRQEQYINPFDFLFGFGDRGYNYGRPREQVGSGSGVIISKDGYIITNNHVVDGANEVSVTLNDEREFTAKVIGTDPQSDIALLKIEGDDFPYLTFGNSDDLKVGEWVLAVGNPFNLTSTVTAGIVSAKNRSNVAGGDLGIQSFIQIDAAVNPGNSGGALVNTHGELVGINTLIYSQTGNFTGYAFAIPVSIAGKIAADLKQYGNVQRAMLGIEMPNMPLLMRDNPEKAKEYSNVKGVIVEGFIDRSPSKSAGLEKGDVIKSINDVTINNSAELRTQLNRYRPGDKVKVTVDRKGSAKSYTVELINSEGNTEITRAADSAKSLGATFKNIPDSRKQQLGINSGVEVESVVATGLFRKNGINKGFIIMRVNNTPVNSGDEITKIATSVVSSGTQDKVLLIAGFYPNGRTQYIPIDLSQK